VARRPSAGADRQPADRGPTPTAGSHAYQYSPAGVDAQRPPGAGRFTTDQLPLHGGEPRVQRRRSDDCATNDPVIEAPAGLETCPGTGELDVVADDVQGNVYAWNAKGETDSSTKTSNPDYSGRAGWRGDPSWEAQRYGVREAHRGRLLPLSPVLADLEPSKKGSWTGHRRPPARTATYTPGTPGRRRPSKAFPVLVEDPRQRPGVCQTRRAISRRFNANVAGRPEQKTKTRARSSNTAPGGAARRAGQNRRASSSAPTRSTWQIRATKANSTPAGVNKHGLARVVGASGMLSFANGRVYAIQGERLPPRTRPRGAEPAASNAKSAKMQLPRSFAKAGRRRSASSTRACLPDVGEGINGSPIRRSRALSARAAKG